MTPLAMQLAALDEDKVSPGLLGFTVVAILAVATWILLKSMTKQLKRVNFEEKDTRGGGTGGGQSGGDRADGPDRSPGQAGADPAQDAEEPRGAADTATAPPADPADARETQGNAAR